MDQIWNGLLDLTSRFIIPDWGSLIALIPIAIVALIVLFFGWLVWRASKRHEAEEDAQRERLLEAARSADQN